MPVLRSVIHKIDKKPDGSPAVLFLGTAEQVDGQARDDLLYQFDESYNATAGARTGACSTLNLAHTRSVDGSAST